MTHSLRNSIAGTTIFVAFAILGTSAAYASEVTGSISSGSVPPAGTIGGTVTSGTSSTATGTISGGTSGSGSGSISGTVTGGSGSGGGGGGGSGGGGGGGGNGPIAGSTSNPPAPHGQVLGASIGPIDRSGSLSAADSVAGAPNTGSGGDASTSVILLLLSSVIALMGSYALFTQRTPRSAGVTSR
jgi:hypothetical protein